MFILHAERWTPEGAVRRVGWDALRLRLRLRLLRVTGKQANVTPAGDSGALLIITFTLVQRAKKIK